MRFPVTPPRLRVVFIREGGDQARLWSVMENRGEIPTGGRRRVLDVVQSEHMANLLARLVIGWRSPHTSRMNATTALSCPAIGIADAEPVLFPGLDRLVLSHVELQAVMRSAATPRGALRSRPSSGSTPSPAAAPSVTTSARPTERRASGSVGMLTQPADTPATSSLSRSIRRASSSRYRASSIRPRRRGISTLPRVIQGRVRHSPT